MPFVAGAFLTIALLSCKKDNSEAQPPAPAPPATVLRDSVSYTLDGITYTCNSLGGEQRGVRSANLDTLNNGWRWDADTMQYFRAFTFGLSPGATGSNAGNLTLHFTNKFAKTQLTKTLLGLPSPESDSVLYYPKGKRQFATDYKRFNHQNGIALELVAATDGSAAPPKLLSTYSLKPARENTTITPASHQASEFTVTNITFVPAYLHHYGGYRVEATFKATMFDVNERPYQVSGFLRVTLD
jgi:hypothetical protein